MYYRVQIFKPDKLRGSSYTGFLSFIFIAFSTKHIDEFGKKFGAKSFRCVCSLFQDFDIEYELIIKGYQEKISFFLVIFD